MKDGHLFKSVREGDTLFIGDAEIRVSRVGKKGRVVLYISAPRDVIISVKPAYGHPESAVAESEEW